MLIIRCLFLMLAVWGANMQADYCAVCSHEPLNAPCVLDTTDGSIFAAEVYPPHPNISNEIWEPADENGYGYFSFINVMQRKGSGFSLPDNNKAEFSIKAEALTTYKPFWADVCLCQDCLNKLSKVTMSNNFAVVDLYGLADGKVEFYALKPGSDFWLRHYHIFVEKDGSGGLDVMVESTYFEGGKELDY